LFKPELGVRLALRRLPPAFRHVSCFWQVTGSAGFKDGFRLRTWHWLSRAVTGAQLKCWLSPAIERGLIDPCTLVEVQPHYIGCTVVGGPDPCPERFGVLAQVEDTVAVPDIDGIRRRQEQREQERRRARLSATKGCQSAGASADTANSIEELVAAVRRAGCGSRHYAYKTALARAKAMCERRSLAWPPVLDQLRRAYESTLTDAEIKQRKKGSIDGLPNWIERRAS
jgi:hypothetical protein